MRSVVWFTVLFLATNTMMLPQAPAGKAVTPVTPAAELEKLKAEQERIQKAKDLVREWFKRWNALDESEESINKFAELYRPDALHLTGPQDDLIGTAFYQGQDMIRKLAQHAGKTYCRQAFYIKTRTSLNQVGEDGGAKTVDLITAASTSLGMISVVVELGASYDYRETKKRFMAPGAAFFEIQDGKIARLRMYYSKGEHFEVTNQAGCTS
ncbi:MAG TPA: nuclear transport factor 2 family protein [Terriglobia bacterium]|nr:nuclear transport factor 2 family protein [Terriglobia bacterium]